MTRQWASCTCGWHSDGTFANIDAKAHKENCQHTIDLWEPVWVPKRIKDTKRYHKDWMCRSLTTARGADRRGEKQIKSVNLGAAIAGGRKPCPYCFK